MSAEIKDVIEYQGAGMLAEANDITENKAALCDRQIQMWGLDSQKRLREAKVLVIGLNGLGAEVVKNLTLSGVKSITIMDNTEVKQSDLSAQFFVVGSKPGQTRAEASVLAIQQLNSNVKISVDNEDISTKQKSFFTGFDVVFATDIFLCDIIRVNKICRENSVQFYCGDTWGFYGYFFVDLSHYKYTRPSLDPVTKEETTVVEGVVTAFHKAFQNISTGFLSGGWADKFKYVDVTFKKPINYRSCMWELKIRRKAVNSEPNAPLLIEFCPIGLVFGTKVGAGLSNYTDKLYFLMRIMHDFRLTYGRLPEPQSRETDIAELKNLRSSINSRLKVNKNKVTDEMISCVFGELSPVCAAVGGVLSNEIIKCLLATKKPLENFFFFDGKFSTATVENLVTLEDI